MCPKMFDALGVIGKLFCHPHDLFECIS